MRYFNYAAVARQAKIPARDLARLRAMVRREFPRDQMLFELHMLRICASIREGRLTAAEALQGDSKAAA